MEMEELLERLEKVAAQLREAWDMVPTGQGIDGDRARRDGLEYLDDAVVNRILPELEEVVGILGDCIA